MRKLFLVAVLALPFAANAGNMKDNVVDQNKSSVVDARGNCVRSKWDGGQSDCAGTMEIEEGGITSVYFDFGKHVLKTDARSELDSMINMVTSPEATELQVTGFADRIGSESSNYDLSKKRALAVKDFLSARGIQRVNTSVQARGETSPVTNCSSEMEASALVSCLQEDRRVDISIVE